MTNDLTSEERRFRALLLESARRLDAPTPESLRTALARVDCPGPGFRSIHVDHLLRRSGLVTVLGLAAGIALYLNCERGRSTFLARPEPMRALAVPPATSAAAPGSSSPVVSLASVPPSDASLATAAASVAARPSLGPSKARRRSSAAGSRAHIDSMRTQARGASAVDSGELGNARTGTARDVAIESQRSENFGPNELQRDIGAPRQSPAPLKDDPVEAPTTDAEQALLVRRSLEYRELARVPHEQRAIEGIAPVRTDSNSSVVVWDGDKVGLRASGWSAPGKVNKTIMVASNVGFNGSVGLRWQAQGRDWMGFGWNWFSWWPSHAGTNVRELRRLVFRLRIESKADGQQPTREGFLVGLSSSTGSGSRGTNALRLAASTSRQFCDGDWHKIEIPIADLMSNGKATGFDPTRVWEFSLGYWSTKTVNFVAYIDDIGFE